MCSKLLCPGQILSYFTSEIFSRIVFQSWVWSSLTEIYFSIILQQFRFKKLNFTLIRVDFEIEFSKEQLSKIKKTNVDIATLGKE